MDELIITTEEDQTVDIFLRPNTKVYSRKREELITQSGMTEDEAENWLLTTPIQLELFYDIDRGLFAAESEAIDCCEIYNPYTGKEIPNENLPNVSAKRNPRASEISIKVDNCISVSPFSSIAIYSRFLPIFSARSF